MAESSSKSKSTSGAEASLVGRAKELDLLEKLLKLRRNVLIEGPVGVGKTFLVLATLKKLGLGYERVDGDSRYSESKLTGWFDPPMVIKKGYTEKTFIEGPLHSAMRQGKVLFINELNRMPEGVQNILLPAMDEHSIQIPKLGVLKAKPGFLVIGTQNPREFTATHALSEAILDRFEMISLDYQTRDDERSILESQMGRLKGLQSLQRDVVSRTVDLVRSTRQHPSIRRGASVRAMLSMCELMMGGVDFKTAAHLALPSRMELLAGEDSADEILDQLLAGDNMTFSAEKKSPRL